ncbi:hypothetical protein SUGI_0553010 [Cryptomeria japonica]|nr:hypothetical protein SUGI_0553010 [Cryptomeria japonica]
MGGITESSYATRTIRVVCDENPLDACSNLVESTKMPYVNQFYLSDKYKLGTVLICNREPPYRSSLNQVNSDYVIILTHLIIIIILRRAFVLTVPTKTTVLTEYFYTTRNGRCSLNIKQP